MDTKPHRGRLAFSVGETQLSAWEAARLAPGDIVLSTREAGYPGFLLFNNLPVGIGEVVLLDDTFAVRIVDSDFRPSFLVDPGRIDQIGEMVPAVFELGALEVGLDELRGLGRNSFINLGTPAGAVANATLMYAGLPLAVGTVMVVGELMSLKITERLAAFPIPEQVRQSGNLADRAAIASAKVYDFSRPDRWSRDQIRKLQEIHRLFQRNLEASVPEAARLLQGRTDALLVDQCTLAEARTVLAAAGLSAFRTWENYGPYRGRDTAPPPPRTLLLETEGCRRPVSRETRRSIEELHTKGGLSHRPVFLHTAPALEIDLRVQADSLRNGWKRHLDFRLDPVSPTAEPVVLPEYEMVILVLLRPSPEAPPVMAVVYPFLTLEPYLQVLGS